MSDLPRVTAILQSAGLLACYPNTPDMARARAKGTALHLALKYHADGVLEERSLHEALRAPFAAYQRFLLDHGHIPEASELELIHERYGFQGHVDRIGTVDEFTTCLVDFKVSDSPDVRGATLQVSGGYRALWDHHHPERPVERCYVLALRKDGTYRLLDVTDSGHAVQVFMAALIVHNERKSHGRL